MCGIAGIIDYNQKGLVKKDTLESMGRQLYHRGPDDGGIFIETDKGSTDAGLTHRRLSIIDLSRSGHQPMPNEDSSLWLVFNGEIYNYHELRNMLLGKGHRFISNTDSEVILHLYEDHGRDCVKFLRGMFAFAIWSSKEKTLFLGRDRVGKKPLLYSYQNGVFVFASEFASLLASNQVRRDINPEAIRLFLNFGYIPGESTIYKNVFKLPPSATLTLKDGKIELWRYWRLDYLPKIEISELEAAQETYRLLEESVKIRLYSDVPLGAFLSGGIDSSAVVAMMSSLSKSRIKTFSIGFEERSFNELGYAREISQRFNTEHHEFMVKPDALSILPLLVERYGEPYADSSCIPTYYVAKLTRQHVTVALNGDGGDELFGGYERYQAMLAARVFQKIPESVRKIIRSLAKGLPDSSNSKNRLRSIRRFILAADLPLLDRYLRWVGVFAEPLKNEILNKDFFNSLPASDPRGIIGPYLNNSYGLGMLDSLLFTDTMTYLPDDLLVKVDITSMANSLEARSPFLDHKLMEFVARLPAEYKIKGLIKKHILKKLMKGILPESNINRRKMGFGVPVGEWFRHDLKDFLCQNLLSSQSLKRGYFKPEAIKHLVKVHLDAKYDYGLQLWTLLMLELWHKRFID